MFLVFFILFKMFSILSKTKHTKVFTFKAALRTTNVNFSKNEKKVLETKSFVSNLFRGRLNLETTFPYPLNLTADRKEMLSMVLGPTENFLKNVNNAEINDAKGEIPRKQLDEFAELGAFGVLVPEEYGGAGMNNTQMGRLAELVGSYDLALGVIMGAHQSIGYKGILLYGTPEQKEKYLPDLASAKKFASFCLTEPNSGSDANSIRSKAVKSECGKYYTLNGSKIYITNGGIADVFTVFAQTPIKQEDGTYKDKVSAFIVERSFGGLTNSIEPKKLGLKSNSTVELYFDNVKIPAENLLGKEGEGFKVAMNILNNGRFGIPAAMTGAMKYCIDKSIYWITNRKQFGHKLQEYVNVHEKLAGMLVRHYATESMLYMLASNMDAGVTDFQLEAAIAKVYSSDSAWQTCDDTIQLYGGMGYMVETGLERVLRDLRVFRIFEGANDVMKIFVALTGMNFAGKHYQQTAKEIKSGGIGTLFSEMKRMATKSTGESFNDHVHPKLLNEAKRVNDCVATFGFVVQKLLMQYRKGIIERQYEQVRIAEAAIDIYASVCSLSRCTYSLNNNAPNVDHEVKIVQLLIKQSIDRALSNLKLAEGSQEKEISLMTELTKEVCSNGKLLQHHPTDL
ncbi:Acyl-CoA oxidase/dehydrogenase, central domain and Acyl-CoA dehydrogenase/oxidase C-terminal domain and Acyl-CoA dehydrogenase/oxidase, N-terminal and middle domain and Acyl-CoA dehydrogenase/oxidase, N-terminal domain-containing protein [Strongyloides ratti]|uniref:Very long-chain specific acyl-CoA dehydrogenase, mitochondrial n=1 Tax=Strongyloides ratti TaxID=34506 RepID=A0A090LC52_STRRB|nr:Acyl-CoA oxidase/dehydrogenase, central domain and Acyl-CoA dehydrogenase/oxidase C-terminal domain and Acyl-CoA dehydrogenase/oxidase, N-terminal and middle domain and Acyl-CoA dehydrogenase/oxidase, N-terminal domain-containing protein [Strongyloides ratti]CEF67376.1 Acyl-CoA oxidase/dehydrogenase, central domain and Acyl-CoA dehydrogenase/oxidase C-terminal domain and Acyl-CoA dehydrogenase/oxidase, N-terminal and middle domain and Acyl-CoA dehydrogenase/oxidase, N-terminal domain-containing